jgi:hypothetical protein
MTMKDVSDCNEHLEGGLVSLLEMNTPGFFLIRQGDKTIGCTTKLGSSNCRDCCGDGFCLFQRRIEAERRQRDAEPEVMP